MNCPKCGAELENDVTVCPACGTPVAHPLHKPGAKAIAVGVVATVVALLFLGAIPALGVAAIALLWIAPNTMDKRLKIVLTVVLAAAIVALPIMAVLAGVATFSF